MNDNTIKIIEKKDPPRIKEEFSTLTIKIRPHNPNVKMSEQVKRGASLKFAKPLVEKIEGPFDENNNLVEELEIGKTYICLLYTSPSPRDQRGSRMPSSA